MRIEECKIGMPVVWHSSVIGDMHGEITSIPESGCFIGRVVVGFYGKEAFVPVEPSELEPYTPDEVETSVNLNEVAQDTLNAFRP